VKKKGGPDREKVMKRASFFVCTFKNLSSGLLLSGKSFSLHKK